MNTQSNIQLSDHAQLRSAQRNLIDDEILFIVRQGVRIHRAGAVFCQLRRIDIPDDLPAGHRYRRLIGSTVVLSSCGRYVLTVYRNARAFRRDLRKRRYFRRSQWDTRYAG